MSGEHFLAVAGVILGAITITKKSAGSKINEKSDELPI